MAAPTIKRKKTNNHLANRKGIRPPKVKEAAITESMFLKQVDGAGGRGDQETEAADGIYFRCDEDGLGYHRFRA